MMPTIIGTLSIGEWIFQLWLTPILLMAFIAMVGAIIHILTLPFLFVWAVMHRRGWEFIKDNPIIILLSVPVLAPLAIGVMFYTVYGIQWVIG